ncbi:hypothetical protein T10_2310 [Trichinella papuae]|uniref:Uncharacterized protein n=1 Tax=Trichinella papuae TaxID=268474 RepID=A0A0V1MKM9_9BILA|nr:hypothetical protein T10_2310 [Trichinella papuae]
MFGYVLVFSSDTRSASFGLQFRMKIATRMQSAHLIVLCNLFKLQRSKQTTQKCCNSVTYAEITY